MIRDFQILDSCVKYENPWLKVIELSTLVDGRKGIYGIVERDDTAVIIVESSTGEILLEKQYRFPTNTFSWELPMGGKNIDESAIEAAARELKEETGLTADLTEIGSFYPVPGLSSQTATVFHAYVSTQSVEDVASSTLISDEIVERRFFTIESITRMIATNQITDGFTLTSLFKYVISRCL